MIEQAGAAIERRAMAKIWWHVVPLTALVLLFNLIDRGNIAYAALQMNEDLGFSNTLFGLGAGSFAIGVLLFGIPSTLLLHRFGARRWIAITMVVWGFFSGATAFVTNIEQLIGCRLLLGMAEAGFIPGATLYFTYWFPARYRGRVMGSFVLMQPVGLIIGGPISGILLSLDQHHGLAGWQWMFLIEAIPTFLLAALIFRFLPDRPSEAKWLAEDERQWLDRALAAEHAEKEDAGRLLTPWSTLASGYVWRLAFMYFALGTSAAGAIYFIPLILRSMQYSVMNSALLATLPPLAAALFLPLWGIWADRGRSREFVAATAAAVMALGLAAAALLLPSAWTIVALAVATTGFFGFVPAFWALPSQMLAGASAAAGIAFISVLGNIGNFAGPYLFGWSSDRTGSYRMGLLCLALFALVTATAMAIEAFRRRGDMSGRYAAAPGSH